MFCDISPPPPATIPSSSVSRRPFSSSLCPHHRNSLLAIIILSPHPVATAVAWKVSKVWQAPIEPGKRNAVVGGKQKTRSTQQQRLLVDHRKRALQRPMTSPWHTNSA